MRKEDRRRGLEPGASFGSLSLYDGAGEDVCVALNSQLALLSLIGGGGFAYAKPPRTTVYPLSFGWCRLLWRSAASTGTRTANPLFAHAGQPSNGRQWGTTPCRCLRLGFLRQLMLVSPRQW